MKKLFILFILIAASTVEAKRKVEQVLLDDEFNPWFQYEEPLPKVQMYRSHSTTPLASKMDKIETDSAEYTPTKRVFGTTRPKHIPLGTKIAIKKLMTVDPKMKKISNDFVLKRENN